MISSGRLPLILFAMFCGHTLSAVTTISVNAGSVVNSFVPYDAFGANTVSWADPRPVRAKLEAAGNFIQRFPGGSWSDQYHWNGTGSYDANSYWVPSSTTASLGSMARYLSFSAENVTDNKAVTVWMSNVNTDFPDNQWIYLPFASQQNVNSVKITWGSSSHPALPYASQFSVQYWNPANSQQWSVYGAPTNGWLNTTAANWAGNGAAQTVTFTAVNTSYIRLKMTQSSDGPGGAYSVGELHAFNGATPVSLAGGTPISASSMDPVGPGGGWIAFSFDQFMGMLNAMTPKGKAVITVNMGSGTAQEAAAWVYYANLVKGYGIKYWEISNEMGGDWEAGGPLNAQDYGRLFIEFVQAMKAVDPSIICLGGSGSGYTSYSELYDGNGYIKDFIDRLAMDSGGNKAGWAEGIVVHDYPGYGKTAAQKLSGLPAEMPSMAAALSTQLANHPQAATVPIWITEYNSWSSNDANDISVRLANGLFVAEYLGEFLKQFGSRGYTQLWANLNGGSSQTQVNGGDLGYIESSGTYQYQPHADYWAMQMMAADWSGLGDTQSHQMVSAVSSQVKLKSYADLRPDGSLALMVDNTDPGSAYTCTVDLAGFNPASQANAWSLSVANYVWETSTLPYHASTDSAPSYLTITGISSSFSYTFPAYSLTVLEFHPLAATPTSTPTPTDLQTASPTETLAMTSTPSPVFSDTDSPTVAPTQTITETATPAFSPSVTASPSPGAAPATPPFGGSGPLVIGSALMDPNPVTGNTAVMTVQMDGPVDELRWSVYSQAMAEFSSGTRSGQIPAGRQSLSFEIAGLPNGIYYVVVRAARVNGTLSTRKVTKMMVLR